MQLTHVSSLRYCEGANTKDSALWVHTEIQGKWKTHQLLNIMSQQIHIYIIKH
jgi:hypothetical protein